jgi:hypothetical protein
MKFISRWFMENAIKYQANPEVSFRDEGEEGAVLYNPDTDKSALMNATGARIWEFISEPKTVHEIAAMLVGSYSGIDTAQAREDALNFLNSFGENFVSEIS